jgi:hypothetical protein
MPQRPDRASRARGGRALACIGLIALPLGGCGSLGPMLGGMNSSAGSTPPYVTDAEKAKAQAQARCQAEGQGGAQDKASDCKKPDSR